MTLYHAFDASTPPSKPFPGTEIVCGYIGGDTPHVWSAEEWNAASLDGHIRVLPIYVVSDASGKNPVVEARKAAIAAVTLGWSRHIRRFIVLDSEVSQDVLFIQDFAHALVRDGFLTLDYRSISVLDTHPSGLPEWAADYSLPPLPSSSEQHGFQYIDKVQFDNTELDVSLFDDVVYKGCGRGPRK